MVHIHCRVNMYYVVMQLFFVIIICGKLHYQQGQTVHKIMIYRDADRHKWGRQTNNGLDGIKKRNKAITFYIRRHKNFEAKILHKLYLIYKNFHVEALDRYCKSLNKHVFIICI